MLSEETKPTFVYPNYIWFNGQLYELTFGWNLPKDCYVATKGTERYYYKHANYDYRNRKVNNPYITNEDLEGKKPEDFLNEHRVLEDVYNATEKWEGANNVVSLNINGGTVQFERKEISEEEIEELNKRGVICFVKLKKQIGCLYRKTIIESMFCLQSKIDPTQKLMWRDFSVQDAYAIAHWIKSCLFDNNNSDFDTFYKKYFNKHSENDNNATNEHATQILNSTKENNKNNLQNVSYIQNEPLVNNNYNNMQESKSKNETQKSFVDPVVISNTKNNDVPPNNFYNQKIENNQFQIPPQANVTNCTNNQPLYQQINNNITQKLNNIMPQPNNIMPKPIKNYPSQNIITTQPVPLLRPIYKPNYCYMLTPKYYRPSRSLYRNKTKTFNRGCYYQQRPTVVYNNTGAIYSRKYYRPKRGLNGNI